MDFEYVMQWTLIDFKFAGHEKLEKALMEWRQPAKLANVTDQKPRNPTTPLADESDALIGLAQI